MSNRAGGADQTRTLEWGGAHGVKMAHNRGERVPYGSGRPMGVDHGRDAGDKSPRIWSRGTLVQISSLRFLSYRYKNEHSLAFKIRQNPFSAGSLPRTPLGELTTLPRPLVGWRGDTLTIPRPIRHRPTFGARHASAQNSSQTYAYGKEGSQRERATYRGPHR